MYQMYVLPYKNNAEQKKTMTRSELIRKLHQKNDAIDPLVVEQATKHIFNKMVDALTEGERIEVRGFGSFSLRALKPHTARNPKTGESVEVGHRFSIYFRPGKNLKDSVKPPTSSS